MMPTYLAAAVLVGALIHAFIQKSGDGVRWIFVATGALLAMVGGGLLYLYSRGSNVDSAGIAPAGIVLLIGGLATVIFALLKKREITVYSQVLAIVGLMWIFVLGVLPDFERYKPVKALSDVIAQNAGPDARVGYYRYTAPTMVYYLHRPVLEYFNEDEIVNLFGESKPAYMIMTEGDYEAIKSKLGDSRVIASRPLLRIRLNELFGEVKGSNVVLVTNDSSQSAL
jgi:hypothetical protein